MKLVKYTNRPDPFFDNFTFGIPAIVDRFLQEFAGESDTAIDTSLRLPRTNVHETDAAWEFTMEVPGVTKKDIEVNLEGDRLVVRAESKRKVEDKGLVRREFRSSRFQRVFPIGTDVDRDKIKARLEDGILTVTLPKVPDKVGRKVEVQ